MVLWKIDGADIIIRRLLIRVKALSAERVGTAKSSLFDLRHVYNANL
jgi:hypothetical protein